MGSGVEGNTGHDGCDGAGVHGQGHVDHAVVRWSKKTSMSVRIRGGKAPNPRAGG